MKNVTQLSSKWDILWKKLHFVTRLRFANVTTNVKTHWHDGQNPLQLLALIKFVWNETYHCGDDNPGAYKSHPYQFN